MPALRCSCDDAYDVTGVRASPSSMAILAEGAASLYSFACGVIFVRLPNCLARGTAAAMAHHHISVVVLSMTLIVAACAAAPGTLWRPHSALEPRAAAAAVASSGTAVCPPEGDRVACVSSWRWDFDQRLCEQRGCCYQPSLTDLDWCFNDAPAGAAAHITKVHVVQGCHLDVGFAATAPEIVNRWFDEFFPLAYRVGKELQEMNANHSAALQGTNTTLRFTAQSWLVRCGGGRISVARACICIHVLSHDRVGVWCAVTVL